MASDNPVYSNPILPHHSSISLLYPHIGRQMPPTFSSHPSNSRPLIHKLDVSSSNDYDQDVEGSPASPASSDSSIDEDEVNQRMSPFWPKYRHILHSRGFHLETVNDVKRYYGKHISNSAIPLKWNSPYHSHQPDLQDDNELCPDAGIPDNLFRGFRLSDSKRVMVKAVHRRSREYDVIRDLSRPPLRDDPMNHCIPVLDFFELKDDDIAFIIMEEWSSQLITDSGPCCLRLFLSALRQCMEHVVFMHNHHIAHLDISLNNLLTDYQGNYGYIDFELSRRFDSSSGTLAYNFRGTELPPECEKKGCIDPRKVDIWALAVLMLRACKLTGYWVPELMYVIEPMLNEDPTRRPSAHDALQLFDKVISSLGFRLEPSCTFQH